MVRHSKMLMRAAVCTAIAAGVSAESAQASVWNSEGSADWSTTANWSGGSVPNLTADGAIADLRSGTALYTGMSFKLAQTGAMTLNGGSFSWTTATSGNYTNVYYGGHLTVNSGAFSAGASTLNVGSTAISGQGYLSVTGGSLSVGGMLNLNNDLSTFSISGGSVSFTGSLYLSTGSMTVSGGTLNANYITFSNSDSISSHLTFSGGQINTKKAWLDTYGATHYVDFAAGSTGVLHYLGDVNHKVADTQIGSGVLRYNGVVDSSAFVVTTDSTGSYIQLAAVPEPASAAMLALPALMVIRRRK